MTALQELFLEIERHAVLRSHATLVLEARKEIETVKDNMTRLLLHLAPDVEPENEIISIYWQLDNAVCGLIKQPEQIHPNACPYCKGTGKGKMNGVEVGCIMCRKTGKKTRDI